MERNLKRVCLPVMVLALLAAVSYAAEYSGLRGIVRDHVRDGRIDDALADSTGWNSLRAFSWQMLLLDPKTGEAKATSSAGEFTANQRFRLSIEAHTDLWIYVMNVAPSGKMSTLLPSEDEKHVLVKAGTRVAVPRDAFRFDDEPGIEQFRVIASPVKLKWIQPLALSKLESDLRLSGDEERAARAASDFRHKSISGMQSLQLKKQARAGELTTKSLPELIETLAKTPSLRGSVKDVVLMPPPSEAAADPEDRYQQDVIMVSDDVESDAAIVIDINLKHK